jgi:hypothetical protein
VGRAFDPSDVRLIGASQASGGGRYAARPSLGLRLVGWDRDALIDELVATAPSINGPPCQLDDPALATRVLRKVTDGHYRRLFG